MSASSQPPALRRVAWEEAGLVEGTEALLWRADDDGAARQRLLPPAEEATAAVVSWVRPGALHFETASAGPLPELVLVSTQAVGGPARFVAHKSYQAGTTAVCEPPTEIFVFDKRELARVAVAVPVSVWASAQVASSHTLDCSPGGARSYLPWPVEVGAKAVLELELGGGEALRAGGVVRHCSAVDCPPAGEGRWVAGFEWASLPPAGRRKLSHFLAQQERRLMPRVKSLTPVEYRAHGREGFAEALASELSPGDLVLSAYEAHSPGDPLEVRIRLRKQEFAFGGRVVACSPVAEPGRAPVRYSVRVCLDLAGPEEQFREAVRGLALGRLASQQPRPRVAR